MTVNLPPEQQSWLEAQVQSGAFASVDDAVRRAISDMMAVSDDTFEWARGHVDAGDAALDRGEGIAGDVFLERLKRNLDALR